MTHPRARRFPAPKTDRERARQAAAYADELYSQYRPRPVYSLETAEHGTLYVQAITVGETVGAITTVRVFAWWNDAPDTTGRAGEVALTPHPDPRQHERLVGAGDDPTGWISRPLLSVVDALSDDGESLTTHEYDEALSLIETSARRAVETPGNEALRVAHLRAAHDAAEVAADAFEVARQERKARSYRARAKRIRDMFATGAPRRDLPSRSSRPLSPAGASWTGRQRS